MTVAYPLRTQPLFRDYLWGGRKLETVLGKSLPAGGVWAESWEMVDHPEHQSIVSNGPLAGKSLRQIAAGQATWLLGPDNNSPKSLPLLLKYLDCQRVLSVQVHPDDEYARQMSPPDLGKTEAWYIVSAEPDAVLYAGLQDGVDQQTLRAALEAGTVESCLHSIRPKAGDCVFIPAGTTHALGAGLLVAEIQQASNTTFRLFDWNRLDAQGKPRALHVEQALEVIDFSGGPRPVQIPQTTSQAGRQRMVECDKFVLDRLSQVDTADVAGDKNFHLLTAPRGGVTLRWSGEPSTGADQETLETGQSVLLPACMPKVSVELAAGAELLDAYLPREVLDLSPDPAPTSQPSVPT